MSKQSAGSPLPWYINSDGVLFDNSGSKVSLEDNAALICDAVNSHKELIDALEGLMAFWPSFQSYTDARKQARKTLERAKGGRV